MPFQLPKQALPALGAFAIPILDRDQSLRPVGSHANHDQRAEAIVIESDVEVHVIDPDIPGVAVGEAPLLKRPILGFPLVGRDGAPRGAVVGQALSASALRRRPTSAAVPSIVAAVPKTWKSGRWSTTPTPCSANHLA
jgi:hypothetical protein